jgi:hypothetical protein
MVRDDIRAFMREPAKFARSVSQESRQDWLAGLEFARKAANEAGAPLRPAQVDAWAGIADHRAALVLGPPGTGKTFVLSWMALAYLEARRATGRPCRIFLTGFTRNSIANLLEAVRKRAVHATASVRTVWLGNEPDQALPSGIEVCGAADAREVLGAEFVVVGATGWSLFRTLDSGDLPSSEGLAAPLFDLVCIDEASQMVVSQGLLGIAGLAGQGRVLVAGDDQQLAPVRETHEREVDGLRLGSSLYGFLKHAGVQVFPLTETFRLNAPLAEYPSRTFYEGRYESVDRDKKLQLVEGWQKGLDPWQQVVLDPDNPVCILLYDGPLCGTVNEFEAKLVRLVAGLFHDRMLPEEGKIELEPEFFWKERLAVVTPHRAQNARIRQGLRGGALGRACVVETVDRIQGRERDVIVAGYTVSDPEFALTEADFIFNAERFNVTITRARTKLVLIVSRRLVNVVPESDEAFERAQVLRNYVFESTEVATVNVAGPSGAQVTVALRVRRFEGAQKADLPVAAATVDPPPNEAELLPEQKELLEAVRRLSAQSKYGMARSFDLKKELYRSDVEIRQGLLFLFESGFVTVDVKDGQYGPYWSARPRNPPQRPLPHEAESVREHIHTVLRNLGSGNGAPYYQHVQQHFRYLGTDGEDRLLPAVNMLVAEGVLAWGEYKGKRTLGLPQSGSLGTSDSERSDLPEEPSEGDFRVLNALEDIEARRINFGVFETWVRPAELALHIGQPPADLAPVLHRLRLDGWLLTLDDGRVRSRAAELARELRYVKQRFRNDDAGKRPFLSRAVKVLFLDRDKPTRDQPLRDTLERLHEVFDGDMVAQEVIRGVFRMLCERWDSTDPLIAGFQARGFRELLPAWFGRSDARSFVITADTGSGKTEAAALPLITAAAIDALRNNCGTRAVLIYPRVRLANNQAQRLAGYLAALARQKGMPRLTLGLQTGEVPNAFPPPDYVKHLWPPCSGRSYKFPLFPCPERSCGGDLVLTPASAADGPDRLDCSKCGWFFDGWVGTGKGLGKANTSIFILTTESLHSWLHSHWRGRLFGDARGVQPPRAVLADEIHLYSHIHGAQVGYALRRLLARIRLNSPDGADRPLAIGMSATLGQPERIWADLTGYAPVTGITPDRGERQPNPKAREYFYFVQPEVESRGKDIAGASTTIQSLMCLAHGMRRRRGLRGGYRAIAFLDSIDKVKRLHGDYLDAEKNNRLARLRTQDYGASPPSAQPQIGCCGHPETCSRFADGECWTFAATDRHQETARGPYRAGQVLAVCDGPVFSAAKSGVDERVRNSDVVFSTSSLEVGFDDPDMMLVYQHYAPLNAASFVQRKGRGGRGADDRPVTGVTLSVYSPRDVWFFRRPERMLSAASFQVPLNMRNFFVRRGQLIAVLLDAAARESFLRPKPSPDLTEATFRVAKQLAAEVFGDGILSEFGLKDLAELWGRVRRPNLEPAVTGLAEWAARIPEMPTRLFDTINLPSIVVRYQDDNDRKESRDEDIALALFTCAPGTVTRRYGFGVAHWSSPVQGTAPWAAVDPDEKHVEFEPVPGGLDALKDELPRYLHREIGGHVHSKVIRPRALHLTKAGRFDGAQWTPFVGFREKDLRIVSKNDDESALGVNPKSEGGLCGFIICDARRDRGTPIAVDALKPLTTGLYAYRGEGRAAEGTGLSVSRIFWGSETRLLVDPERRLREEFVLTQTFVDPTEHLAHIEKGGPPPRVLLHGYQVNTEGIRLRLDSETLDRFVAGELNRLRGTGEERWLRGQYFRFLVLSQSPEAGLNRFQAREVADLLVTARAFPDSREALSRVIRRWDASNFRKLLEETYQSYLNQHPLLTPNRIKRLGEEFAKPRLSNFRNLLDRAVNDCRDDERFKGYLRSLAVHGLAVRLQQLFVVHGAGDPRRVLFHTKLPIQFGERAEDVIVVCEDGEHGDGTTRTFLERCAVAFADLRAQGLSECPNAREDEVLDRLLNSDALVARWAGMDPTSEEQVLDLTRALSLDPEADSGIVQTVLRMLTATEDIGGERFAYLALHREVHAVRDLLFQAMDREPSAWELVGRVVALAQGNDKQVPNWAGLWRCYAGLEDASQEGSLGAAVRLGDQVFRLSARLCVDGCQACLHTGSPLFPPQLMDATVSRRVLLRLEEALGWR